MSEIELKTSIEVTSIAMENLRFGYDERPAVDNVSFLATRGERIAIVGPNGCGKSTLLKLIIGSLRPVGGKILLDGKDTHTLTRTAMARRIAMVPQMAGGAGAGDSGLSGGGFTVRQIVLMGRYALHADRAGALGALVSMGFETQSDLRAADVAMWGADVHHLADRPMETLSGGERQRVAIARAFAQETAIMLLDEPASALDLYHQLELIAQLEEAAARRIILMVTHDLNLAARSATRVLVMNQGKLVADGPPAAVMTPAVLESVYHVKVITESGTLRFARTNPPQ